MLSRYASLFECATDGSTLGQLPTTADVLTKLALNVENLTIDATSGIDVTARGFLGGSQPGNVFGDEGMTVGFQKGSEGRSGGSYGGLGGASNGSTNSVYGDFRDPNEPGSGGSSFGNPTGNGGGLVRIVAQTVQLDGMIKADGGVRGSCCSAGGGSGGGIRIDVGTLSGTGQITANGGGGSGGGGGGGAFQTSGDSAPARVTLE